MKAIYFEKFGGPIQIANLAMPSCTDDGVVVKVAATGLCRSDWHGWMGHDSDVQLPHVPGHELAGTIVEAANTVRRWKIGDRVTVPFSMGCGTCSICSAGDHQICDNYYQPGFTGWGSFAEYVSLPFADVNLVRIPDWMEFDVAASLGCRFVTSFRAVVAQGNVKPDSWVAVHGCGGVGLSAIMIAASLGAQVIAVDINDDALKLARSLGATFLVNARADNVVEKILDVSGVGANVSIDALGSSITNSNSVRCLRKRGRHIQVGLMADSGANAENLWPDIIAKELEILGSHGMSAQAYPHLLRLIENKTLRPEELVCRHVSLSEAAEILPGMGSEFQTGVTVIDRFE